MNVYLAAPYQMKAEISARAAELRALGIGVTSSWLEEPHKPSTQMQDLTPAEHRVYATRDVDDVLAADVFVFQGDPTKTIVRAGRHVEFGIALAASRLRKAMPIFVVGEDRENIFHHMDGVRHLRSWSETKATLVELLNYSNFVGGMFA